MKKCIGLKNFSPSRLTIKSGFTLIELLVVIAIIALLAAILFPVFGRARENARRSACASNMKQIGLAVLQYQQDFDERFPISGTSPVLVADATLGGAGLKSGSPFIAENFSDPSDPQWVNNWISSTQAYTKSWQIYRCPSSEVPTGNNAKVFNGSGYIGNVAPTVNSNSSYAASSVLVGKSVPTSAVQNAANIVLIQEGQYYYNAAMCFPWSYDAPYATAAGPILSGHHFDWIANQAYKGLPETGSSLRHFSGGNLLYADGHVKWQKQSQLMPHDWGFVDNATACGVRGRETSQEGYGLGTTSCAVDKTLVSYPN